MATAPISTETFSEFAEALSRLESTASLYPVTHTRSREAGTRAREAMLALTSGEGVLAIEIADERLMIGSCAVPLSTRVLQALHSELDCLGLSRLEIDATATGEELHHLALRMRSVCQRTLNTHNLQVVDLGDLPSTIRVRHREFGRRVGASGTMHNPGGAIDSVMSAACSPLMSANVDPRTREACEGWVKKSLRRIVERVETRTPSTRPISSEAEQRSLDEVLQLAGSTMEHALTEFLSNVSDPNELQRMFHSIEMATAVCDDPESARLMVEVLNESATEVLSDPLDVEALEPQVGSEEYQLTLDELRHQLTALRPENEKFSDLERDDRSERLSIVLGILTHCASEADGVASAASLQHELAPPWSQGEKQVMTAAIQELCASGSEPTIDRALPAISAWLGDGYADLWLGIAVLQAKDRSAERLTILWPHLANQVLLGSGSETCIAKALDVLARLPRAGLEKCMPRLAKASAFQRGSFAAHAFACDRDDLAPFQYALLRSIHGDVAGELLLASLQARPPTWRGSVVFKTFARFDTVCRDLLHELLRNGSSSMATSAVQAEAARIIAQRVATLPLERAGEAWFPRALEALGDAGTSEAERALLRIVNERKHVIFPLWPSHCRRAARRALASRRR